MLLPATILYGVIGYRLLVDRASGVDGLYWTALTLGGVGFRDTEPLGQPAELFSVSLIVLLLVGVALTAGVATDLVASGDLGRLRARNRMQKMISRLQDHVIICGYGRVGKAIADELASEGVPICVAEIDPRQVAELVEAGVPHVDADPSHEAVLIGAGIERARGLVCAVDSDAANVFITLTARGLRPDLPIVARAAEPETVHKLERAGADSVISPYVLAGQAMARRAMGGPVAAVTPADVPGPPS